MAVAYFTIPETGKIIYNGDTVILSEYPDTIAVVAYGWYKYEENAMNGWHFILLPAKTVVPATQVNLSLLTVVPNSSDDDRNPVPLSPELHDIESRAFITLDSIAQRDKLITEFMPNGRIVRVNDSTNNTTNYYEWNVETQSWDDWNIGSTIKLSDLEDDAEHRLVTDEEKETWNNKPDADIIQKKIQIEEVTIHTGDWSENAAVINSISGITSETKLIIQPRYGYGQYMYSKCGIYQSDQLDDSIEFHCDTLPQDNILLDIYIIK